MEHGNGTRENEAEKDLISPTKLSYTARSTNSDIFFIKNIFLATYF